MLINIFGIHEAAMDQSSLDKNNAQGLTISSQPAYPSLFLLSLRILPTFLQWDVPRKICQLTFLQQ
jgi:hypothetical protein